MVREITDGRNTSIKQTGRKSLVSQTGSFAIFLAICTSYLLFAQTKATTSPQRFAVSVPFVGCKSDGQVGPLDAPTGKNKVVLISANTAKQLAYYKPERGPGVLAPLGWYCFGTYGSSGENLFLTPRPIDTANLFSTAWNGFTGAAIQITYEYGDTSGRFGVASIIARVFPAHRAFVQQVIAGDETVGIKPPNSYQYNPYPKDKLTYRSKEIVEYQTPAKTDGLGTDSRLHKNEHPISGAAILVGTTPNLIQLSVRLPQDQADLTQVIIDQVERDTAEAGSN